MLYVFMLCCLNVIKNIYYIIVGYYGYYFKTDTGF